MDYVPGPTVVLTAIAGTVFLAFLRVPAFLIGILALLSFSLVYAQHMGLFKAEYRTAGDLGLLTQFAPFIMVGIVILLALGYIFIIRGFNKGPELPGTQAIAAAANGIAQNLNRATTTLAQNIPALNTASRNNFLKALEQAV